jgi:formate hydrogenlyase subunit 6/NADH:ubiquinone oxidoreductase subunit I
MSDHSKTFSGHRPEIQYPSSGYWGNIWGVVASVGKGLSLTFSHLMKSGGKQNKASRINIQDPTYFQSQRGIATVQYPHEKLPVPDIGRYKLHNEMDDCIVCDKCVRICPVNCITIEAIRSPEEFGKTSDGTSKRIYGAKFDIDMGKCCFCGLCTTVCPTECLTMTPVFDFSSYSMDQHYFKFGNMTDEEVAQRKKEWAIHQENKQNAAATTPGPLPSTSQPKTGGQAKPVFKPKIG